MAKAGGIAPCTYCEQPRLHDELGVRCLSGDDARVCPQYLKYLERLDAEKKKKHGRRKNS